MIELDLTVQTPDEMAAEVQKMMLAGLYNPLIEKYEILNG